MSASTDAAAWLDSYVEDKVSAATEPITAALTQAHTDLQAAQDQHTADTAAITGLQDQVADLQARIAELEAQQPPPPPPPAAFLVVGSSPGSVGLAGIDQALGHPAPLMRIFDTGLPARWSTTNDLPPDGRPVLASMVAEVDALAAGKLDAQVKAWLADAPKGNLAAALHEGDHKVRTNVYTKAQWIAAQERFLPLAAAAGLTPVPILTYQSVQDGTAASYITSAMRAVPGLVLGIDTYQPGTPSATVAKMVQGMDTLAASLGVPWGIPELGIGTNNGTDADRAAQLKLILAWCADHDARFVCYWPKAGDKADYVPGPASWAALGAAYPTAA